ncbi:putative RNA 3'-terminal phosphate cyclase-like protein [Porphyridium purpureum]|uniref:Putative RNA 3'-terminal phosphate cyclase-like protein n=1 Tax=Porphyridium purpureum TaxID=35688 RepID=A0A5J4Z0M4_PORPP|nr:putative RNA 3'-terminal phosphate cyclase-like protein [Porphyridium purpureum]|eukprot:POR8992..scf208_2
MKTSSLQFRGAAHLKHRLILATLSGKSIKVTDIRPDGLAPGLRDYEISLLRLLDALTTGMTLEINETGTAVRYVPGYVRGGDEIVHECATSRGIGYYAELVFMLAPFGKKTTRVVLKGVTNNPLDESVDVLEAVTVPLMRRLGLCTHSEPVHVKMFKRGLQPGAGGEMVITCPVIPKLDIIKLTDPGYVKRVRGVAFSCRVSPAFSNRLIDETRRILNDFTGDVFIYSDHAERAKAGNSPGFGITLVSESTTHCLLATDATSSLNEQEPEQCAKLAAYALLDEIDQGGCIPSSHQCMVLLAMALSEPDVSKLVTGKLSNAAIQLLRDIRLFLGVTFKIKEQEGSEALTLSCIGVGMVNAARNRH